MRFIDRLLNLLKEKKLSKNKFLQELHMGKNQILYWQNNPETLPNHSTLDNMARFLDVNVDYLTGDTDDRTPYPTTSTTEDAIKVALFGGDREVSDEMWNEVKDYVEFLKSKYFKDDD